jgi:hypothetical protein
LDFGLRTLAEGCAENRLLTAGCGGFDGNTLLERVDVLTENLDGFPPAPSLLRAFVVHSVFGLQIPSSIILPFAFSRPLSAFRISVFQLLSFQFLLSTFCFLLSPKRRFGALRPHAEPPFVQKLRSDPDKGQGFGGGGNMTFSWTDPCYGVVRQGGQQLLISFSHYR